MPTVTVSDAARDDRAVLLDVRERDEWEAGRAPQAVHVPMSELVARLDELPRDRPLNVVCHLGGRSAQVTGYLLAHGYDARNVDGGMRQWGAAGLPLEASDGRTPDVG